MDPCSLRAGNRELPLQAIALCNIYNSFTIHFWEAVSRSGFFSKFILSSDMIIIAKVYLLTTFFKCTSLGSSDEIVGAIYCTGRIQN